MRDRSLPGPEGRKARGRTAARKRGSARLTIVKDPGAQDPSARDPGEGGLGGAGSGGTGSGGTERGDGGPGDGGLGGTGIEGAEAHADGFGGESSGAEGLDGAEPEALAPGGEEAARVICLRLLTSGPRTRAQLAAALRKRRIPDEVAESVLGRFAEVGLIDDAAFARAWVESRHHGRGLGRRVLAAELRQRGVADGEVRSAVSLLGPQDELAAAQRLVAKRVVASRGKPMPVRARQLMGMLARKGYPAGLAAQVVREALEQDQADTAGSRTDLAWICEDGTDDEWA